MDVGREIRRRREAKGWSQAKLAAAADMGVSGVSQIETGTRNPSAITLEKLAGALGIEVADLFPKAQAPLSLEDDEQRRLHYLKPWVGYVNLLANNVERLVEDGRLTNFQWADEFNRDVISLTFLYDRILPPPEEQTEGERLELLKLSDAIDRLHEVAEKMYVALEPIIAESHREYYAKEREERKAAFKVFDGRRIA